MKALIYKRDYRQHKKGDITMIVEEIPKNHLISNDICEVIEVAADVSKEIPLNLLQVVDVPADAGVASVQEHWTNSEDIVYDVNDIPTLIDENGEPYLDPSYTHVEAIEGRPAKVGFREVQKSNEAIQFERNKIMSMVKDKRAILLKEADIEINKREDLNLPVAFWRSYRQNLRDITEDYKKLNGEWRASVDSIIVEEFEFPVKPQE